MRASFAARPIDFAARRCNRESPLARSGSSGGDVSGLERAMSLRVSGKNIDIGESLRTYVGARLDQVLLKFSAEPAGGRVVIEREGSGFRTDCTLYLDAGLTLQAEAAAHDAYSSFDKAAVRIETRLRRCKRRLKDRSSGHFTP
ncbi:MAG: ribosome-associated translation inhibitor RaiA [Methylovirgula sp.]